jgi:GH15 family glucan-1,4-alpha-glucosidase
MAPVRVVLMDGAATGSEQASPHRLDGFADIEDYAALGDGRTVALLARDGRIDWWPQPTIDSPPTFAAIVDPVHGGYLSLQPTDPDFTASRRYLPDTNVVETTFRTTAGGVRLSDALTLGGSGPLPWGELVRRVEGLDGSVDMSWQIEPGSRFETAQPWVEIADGSVTVHVGDQHLGVRCFDVGEAVVAAHTVSGRFATRPGSLGILAVTSVDSAPLFLPERAELEHHFDRTISRWQEWSAGVQYDGQWSTSVRRSALALKLLQFAPTGAIAAAPTTSLPEQIGGAKNWDYRYMWVRDSSYTVDAFMELGLHEEVQSAVAFLLAVIRRSAPDLHVFYTLDGDIADDETELAAPGYRGSMPVRAGNSAAGQTQLGTFGDLFDTMWHYVRNGHLLDTSSGQLLAGLADTCCDTWRQPDAGIWELPDPRHYTNSKIGCWVALDRAVRLAEARAIDARHSLRWAIERDEIKAWVNDNCWSHAQGSYSFYAGSDQLDASTLLAGPRGFDRGERLAGTVAAIQRELVDGPLVYRYTGMPSEEGAFLACSFWLVSALAHLGRREEAVRMMDAATALANDVGLLAEQMGAMRTTPTTGSTGSTSPGHMLGNFPQGLSHLALINAATTLAASA